MLSERKDMYGDLQGNVKHAGPSLSAELEGLPPGQTVIARVRARNRCVRLNAGFSWIAFDDALMHTCIVRVSVFQSART